MKILSASRKNTLKIHSTFSRIEPNATI